MDKMLRLFVRNLLTALGGLLCVVVVLGVPVLVALRYGNALGALAYVGECLVLMSLLFAWLEARDA